MTTIDPSKQYRTRDGREVRIYAVDGGGKFPVHGAILPRGGSWIATTWSGDGYEFGAGSPCPRDLIPVPERHTLWVNVCRGTTWPVLVYNSRPTRREADEAVNSDRGRIARVRIEFEEGQFDE